MTAAITESFRSKLAGESERRGFWVRIVEEWVRQNFLMTPSYKVVKSFHFSCKLAILVREPAEVFIASELFSKLAFLGGRAGAPSTTVNLGEFTVETTSKHGSFIALAFCSRSKQKNVLSQQK